MMRLVLFLIGLSPIFLQAQSDSTMQSERLVFPKYRVGYSPTALVHWLPAIQFSGDVALKGNLNYTAEVGYIYYGRPLDFFVDRDLLKTSGIQVRTGLEFAMHRGRKSIFALGVYYIAKSYTYHELNWRNIWDYGYRKLEDVPTSVAYNGFAMGCNWGIRLSDQFFLDLGLGFGRANRNTSGANISDRNISDPIFYINTNVSYVFESKSRRLKSSNKMP